MTYSVVGIIPARAGFTAARSPTRPSGRDHPRSRGVYWDRRQRVPIAQGSSPLARGLPDAVGEQGDLLGIIPARAGFTPDGAASPLFGVDHPRSRGVYAAVRPAGPSTGGSSPLARGLLNRLLHRLSYVGIIPARAGFTRKKMNPQPALTDHPRSRGVYSLMGRGTLRRIGSSPLARGLRSAGRPGRRRTGIIPARAGFT